MKSFLLILASGFVGLTLAGVSIPIGASLLAIILTSVPVFRSGSVQQQPTVLAKLFWVVYAVPFITLIPYVFGDFQQFDPKFIWGVSNIYVTNESVVQLTAALGAIGALGLSLGIIVGCGRVRGKWMQSQEPGVTPDFSPLSYATYFLFLILATAVSYLARTSGSISDTAYTDGSSIASQLNWDGTWMLGIALLFIPAADALLDSDPDRRRVKLVFVFTFALIIVVGFGLATGSRATLFTLLALPLALLFWVPKMQAKRVPGVKLQVAIAMVLLSGFVLGQITGSIRTEAVTRGGVAAATFDALSRAGSSPDQFFKFITQGTWTSVLLTPLSVAGDSINEGMENRFGSDYFDIFASVIPSPVANAIGYERPLTAKRGPAYEMRFGQGGTHAVVLPFRNFGLIGIFIILYLLGLLLVVMEGKALRSGSVSGLAFLLLAVVVAPRWFWYSDKNAIAGFIAWGISTLLYKLVLDTRNKSWEKASLTR